MLIGVTGALGLLGAAVAREALERGHDVVAIDRRPGDGVTQADITDLGAITEAFAGLDAVVHTASLIDLHLGEPAALDRVNVDGAKNVVAACRSNGITRLVHMSSAEVICGAEPVRGLTEQQASYPTTHLTHYGVTKQRGEEVVLNAADDQLGTCVMRTFGLFGPGDNTVVPLFLKAMPGRRQMFLGDLSAKTDVVFAPNLAHAMVLAAEQLEPGIEWSGTPSALDQRLLAQRRQGPFGARLRAQVRTSRCHCAHPRLAGCGARLMQSIDFWTNSTDDVAIEHMF